MLRPRLPHPVPFLHYQYRYYLHGATRYGWEKNLFGILRVNPMQRKRSTPLAHSLARRLSAASTPVVNQLRSVIGTAATQTINTYLIMEYGSLVVYSHIYSTVRE